MTLVLTYVRYNEKNIYGYNTKDGAGIKPFLKIQIFKSSAIQNRVDKVEKFCKEKQELTISNLINKRKFYTFCPGT